MAPRDLLSLLALGALWGASFLFIKLGVDEVPPVGVVAARMTLGGLTVLAVATVTGHRAGTLRALRRPSTYVLGMLNGGLPYLCFAWAETRVASGIAAIANASAPVFSALISHLWPRRRGGEDLTLRRGVGVLVGMTGVAVLVGVEGLHGDVDLAGLGVVFVAPVLYSVGALEVRYLFRHDHHLVPATSTNIAASLLLLPLALALGRPAHGVSLRAGLALLALGAGGTGIAYVLFYRLLFRIGPTRSLTVTYLLPGFALVYGAVFLGEAVRPVALLALLLILGGVAIANDLGRRRPPPAAPETAVVVAVPVDGADPPSSRGDARDGATPPAR